LPFSDPVPVDLLIIYMVKNNNNNNKRLNGKIPDLKLYVIFFRGGAEQMWRNLHRNWWQIRVTFCILKTCSLSNERLGENLLF